MALPRVAIRVTALRAGVLPCLGLRQSRASVCRSRRRRSRSFAVADRLRGAIADTKRAEPRFAGRPSTGPLSLLPLPQPILLVHLPPLLITPFTPTNQTDSEV